MVPTTGARSKRARNMQLISEKLTLLALRLTGRLEEEENVLAHTQDGAYAAFNIEEAGAWGGGAGGCYKQWISLNESNPANSGARERTHGAETYVEISKP
jgi:hypothetical protein